MGEQFVNICSKEGNLNELTTILDFHYVFCANLLTNVSGVSSNTICLELSCFWNLLNYFSNRSLLGKNGLCALCCQGYFISSADYESSV